MLSWSAMSSSRRVWKYIDLVLKKCLLLCCERSSPRLTVTVRKELYKNRKAYTGCCLVKDLMAKKLGRTALLQRLTGELWKHKGGRVHFVVVISELVGAQLPLGHTGSVIIPQTAHSKANLATRIGGDSTIRILSRLVQLLRFGDELLDDVHVEP